LIGRILLRTVAREDFGRRALTEFWVRRWFRTLPNYFFVFTVLFVAHSVLGETPAHALRYLSFTQYLASPPPAFFGESWSLAIEEWFYLLVPIPLYVAATR
jgi:peptidoglycan/LPS O-acetylase OafA/YrhL